ncbi:cation diffusion facilitator family metal ion transporter [Apiospora phragmitis]|uniref:Cation diffusion facilitator family metal ion transporter n=1 Tax=Apiospora phragmitis TaxID=2905665 RepID=A0ABR1X7J1_9PEZI
MAGLRLTPKQKLIGTIVITFSFFVAEIVVAFMTGSLALLADAFHYLNDLIGFVVALVAVIISQDADSPQDLSFGWARASLLGAFFNGVFLLALGVSIFLQSIERFISLKKIENPKLVLIMGCVGLTLNILSATLLHEHHGHHHHSDSGHHHAHHSDGIAPDGLGSPTTDSSGTLTPLSTHADHRHTAAKLQSSSSSGGRDLGMLGALTHVLSDALNNVGVIIAALVVWVTRYDARFYADPGVSMGIAVMILLSSLPLIPGINSVHELHIWRLDQTKAVASAHVVVGENDTVADFMERARTVNECLHAYGIHSTTLQPEVSAATPPTSTTSTLVSPSPAPTIKTGHVDETACQMVVCGEFCKALKCCAGSTPL